MAKTSHGMKQIGSCDDANDLATFDDRYTLNTVAFHEAHDVCSGASEKSPSSHRMS